MSDAAPALHKQHFASCFRFSCLGSRSAVWWMLTSSRQTSVWEETLLHPPLGLHLPPTDRSILKAAKVRANKASDQRVSHHVDYSVYVALLLLTQTFFTADILSTLITLKKQLNGIQPLLIVLFSCTFLPETCQKVFGEKGLLVNYFKLKKERLTFPAWSSVCSQTHLVFTGGPSRGSIMFGPHKLLHFCMWMVHTKVRKHWEKKNKTWQISKNNVMTLIISITNQREP